MTMSGISRVTQGTENAPSLAVSRVTSPVSGSLGCQRCGGMLVDEHCMDIGEEGSGHRFWGTFDGYLALAATFPESPSASVRVSASLP